MREVFYSALLSSFAVSNTKKLEGSRMNRRTGKERPKLLKMGENHAVKEMEEGQKEPKGSWSSDLKTGTCVVMFLDGGSSE